jgi:hypothetical protein
VERFRSVLILSQTASLSDGDGSGAACVIASDASAALSPARRASPLPLPGLTNHANGRQ